MSAGSERSKFKRSKRRFISTRERFVSVLRGGSYELDSPQRWRRRSELVYPFLVILVFFGILFVVKMAVQVQNAMINSSETSTEYSQPAAEPAPDEEEMTYEEAKSIFGGG